MSRTILDPQYANDLNGLFDGSGTIVTGSIETSFLVADASITSPSFGVLNATTSTTYTNLTCTAGNTLAIGNGGGSAASNGTLDVGAINVSGIITAEVGGGISSPSYGVYNPTTTTSFINLSCPNSNILAIGNGSGVNAYNGDLLCSDIGVSGVITCATSGSIVSPSIALYVNTTDDFVNVTGSGNTVSIGNSSGAVGASNGVLRCASIILSSNGATGTLSVNSAGALTWNNVVIS